MNFFYRNDGSVTVFLAMLLIPFLILSGVTVDALRIYGAKTLIADCSDLAQNTALADYNKVLKDVYGLLCISGDEEELSNNLVKYYESTLNSVGLEINDEDEYTVNVLNDIRSIISSTEKNEFNNLVDMTTEKLEVVGIEGSQILYPHVVERQIVEYMKYRGIVSIGNSLVDKLKIFKEVPKQQQMLESKMDYENSLSEIDKICEDVYKSIVSYENSKKQLGNFSALDIVDFSKNGNSNFMGLIDITYLLNSIYLNENFEDDCSKIEIGNPNKVSYNEVYSFFNTLDYEKISDEIGEINDNSEVSEIVKYYYSINENIISIVKAKKYFDLLNDKFEDYQELLKKSFTGKKGEVNKELVEANLAHEKLLVKINLYIDDFTIYYDDYDNRLEDIEDIINLNYTSLNLDLNNKYQSTKNMETEAAIIVDKLEELKGLLPKLETKNNEWKEKIDQLEENDIKKSFELQHDQSYKSLNTDEIDFLKNIFKNNLEYASEFCKSAENATYFDELFIFETEEFNLKKDINITNIGIKDFNQAIEIFNENFTLELSEKLTKSKLLDYDKSEFVGYLSNTFKNIELHNANENESEKEKDSIFDTAKETVNVIDAKLSSNLQKNKIPTKGEIFDGLATTIMDEKLSDVGDELANSTDLDEDFNDISTNQNAIMQNSVGLLEGIMNFGGDLVEEARDDLLISEYITEMFSCATTSVLSEKSKKVEKTLSGVESNEKNNFVFGSEIEYILWGKTGDETHKNNTYTATTIFGIRFALNSLYAYTDAEIKATTLSIAVSLAGFTGFGVPLVQNVLILALAMGETAIDLKKLLDGEDVVVYKSFTTWVLKPSNLTKETIIYTAKTITEKSLDSLHNSIVEFAETASDNSVKKLETAFDAYADSLVEDMVASIVNLILTPININLDFRIDDASGKTEIKLDEYLEQAYSSLVKEIEKDSDSLLKEVKLLAIDFFINNYMQDIQAFIENHLSTVSDPINDLMNFPSLIEGKIDELIDPMKREIKEMFFENGYTEFKNEAKKAMKNLTDDVKNGCEKIIDDFVSKITVDGNIGKVTGTNTNFSPIMTNVTLNYKEYLKVFIFSGMLGGKKETYLIRMMDLIKLNISLSMDDEFELKDSYTMLKINSIVGVKTTFMRQRVFGNPWSENRFSLNHTSIFGY